MPKAQYYQVFLRNEFLRRQKANRRYSLRAFARFLGLDHSSLSRILAAKRTLSISLAANIADRLGLNLTERRLFISSIVSEKTGAGAGAKRLEAFEEHAEGSLEEAFRLEQDSFALVAEWHHFGILELTKTRDFDSNPVSIARRLGLTVTEVRIALDRLLRLNLLARTSKDRLKKKPLWIETQDPARTSEALKRHHAQFLEKSGAALREVPLEKRAHYTSMFSLDPAKIGQAKELIRKFTEEMNELTSTERASEVYWLGVGLVPLTHPEDGEAKNETDRKVG